MIGWDTVRNLVSALRFVEHFARRSPGLRELMVLSLFTATHSRQVSALSGYPRPEEAYVCGLFRNLGEVAMARYYGPEYAAMVDVMDRESISDRAAAIRIFDVSPEEVASKLAAAWSLPGAVRTCFNGPETAASMEERRLASAVSYGHELTSALYRKGARFESVHLRTVMDANGKQVLISQRDLRRIVDTAIGDTSHTLSALRIGVPALHVAQQAEQARAILVGGEEPRVHCDLAAIDSGSRALAAYVREPGFDITVSVSRALDLLTMHGGFERAVFGLVSEDRGRVRGRIASGGDAALESFDFAVAHSDPALQAVMFRRQDLWIKRRVDSRYDASAIVVAFGPSHFAMLPVVVDGVVAGLLYADRRELQTADDMRSRIAGIRDVLAEAIGRVRL